MPHIVRDPNESDADYIARLQSGNADLDRRVAVAESTASRRRSQAVGAAIAAGLIAVAFIAWTLFAHSADNSTVIADHGELRVEHKLMDGKLDKLIAAIPTSPASAATAQVCPAAGNVVISIEEYEKLKARPKSCPKVQATERRPPTGVTFIPNAGTPKQRHEEHRAEVCTNQEGVNPKAVKNSRGCTCYIDNTKGDIVIDFFVGSRKDAETMTGAECRVKKDEYVAGKRKVGQADQEKRSFWKRDPL